MEEYSHLLRCRIPTNAMKLVDDGGFGKEFQAFSAVVRI